MKIRPLFDRVLVRRLEEEERTASGLYIPDAAREKTQWGQVEAVGHGRELEDGRLKPLSVKVGDKVLLDKYAGNEFKMDGIEYLMVREDDILGVMEE